MKEIRTQDSVGHVLCHDVTQIIPGVTKDAVFRKGHIIREEDIPVLLSIGKEHIYIWENDENVLHENEAAEIMRDFTQGIGTVASSPKEGKIELTAEWDGVLDIQRNRLDAVNALGEMMIATQHGGFPVRKGDKLAGMRIIPLVIEKKKMDTARQAAGEIPIVSVKPFRHKKYGIVTTGNEVYRGRIEDKFSPVIREKMAEYGAECGAHVIVDDNHEKITAEICKMLGDGLDVVICTGGMSVDPDDRTPLAIRNSGARVVTYGAPVLPGAMFLLAYTRDSRPVLGLPGCVMYSRRTVFDLVLPAIMADVPLTKEQIDGWGEGGLCLNCEQCTFPHCGFGR